MILHVLFQVLCFLLGITLLISALVFDAELDKYCPEIFTEENSSKLVTVRTWSNIIMAIGALMFSITTTVIVYSFIMAGTGKSQLNNPTYFTLLIYLITVALVSGTVLIGGAIGINTALHECCSNSENLRKLKEYTKGFNIIGGLGFGLSVLLIVLLIFYMWMGKKQTKGKKSWFDRSGTLREAVKGLEANKDTAKQRLAKEIKEKQQEIEKAAVKKEQYERYKKEIDEFPKITKKKYDEYLSLIKKQYGGQTKNETLKTAYSEVIKEIGEEKVNIVNQCSKAKEGINEGNAQYRRNLCSSHNIEKFKEIWSKKLEKAEKKDN